VCGREDSGTLAWRVDRRIRDSDSCLCLMRRDATGIDRAVGGLDSWIGPSNYNIIMVAVGMVTILLVRLSLGDYREMLCIDNEMS